MASAPRPASDVPPRVQGRRRPAPQSRGAIVEAVRELLKVRRLEELTVAEIVERAGISRPTFYASFDTKYSVVAALTEGVGERIIELWQPVFGGDGPLGEQQIRPVAIATIGRWREQASLFTATVEGWHSDPEIHAVWSSVLDRFSDELGDRLRRLRDPEPSDDMLVASLVALFERCLYLAVSTPDSVFGRSDEELADVLAIVWARALVGR